MRRVSKPMLRALSVVADGNVTVRYSAFGNWLQLRNRAHASTKLLREAERRGWVRDEAGCFELTPGGRFLLGREIAA